MSVPFGAEDELVCPKQHLEFLDERLAASDALDLLVIGYSAYDQSVITKLVDAKREVRSLVVVNPDAEPVAARLSAALGLNPRSPRTTFSATRFSEWVKDDLRAGLYFLARASRR